ICGGAALNRAYVEDDLRAAYTSGPVYYGADAFAGLHIMDELTGRARVPTAPFWGAQIVGTDQLDLGTVLQYVNKKSLFRLQWQYRQGKRSEDEYRRFVTEFVEPRFRDWQKRVRAEQTLQPSVVYGYWPCYGDRNTLVVLAPEDPG